MRDTTKWLVAAAAAVGGVLVAGLQLSRLPSDGFAVVALAGFVLAIVGVALIILSAATVLSVGYTTLGQLTDIYYKPEAERQREVNAVDEELRSTLDDARATRGLRKMPLWRRALKLRRRLNRLLQGRTEEGIRISEMVAYLDRDTVVLSTGLARSLPSLYDRIRSTDDTIIALRKAEIDRGSTKHRAGSDDGDAGAAELSLAEWQSARLESAGARLIAFANQKLIETKFQRLKHFIMGGGAMVAGGVVAFALAPLLGTLLGTPSLQVDRPTAVTINLVSGGVIDRGCTLRQLPGVAIGGRWSNPTVVTAAMPGCPSRMLKLTNGIGRAVPSVAATGTPQPLPSTSG
jgi:hypothetical protein